MAAESKIIRIVITGPESTGKSTLTAQLAAHYHTLAVQEYAREFLEINGPAYSFEDLYLIARGQIAAEDNAAEDLLHEKPQNDGLAHNLLFLDTDLRVIKIWSEYVFNRADPRVLTAIAARNYDLFLLCDVDLPWVKDDLREYPEIETRQKLFHYYTAELAAQDAPWTVIRGTDEQRLASAVRAVERFLTENNIR